MSLVFLTLLVGVVNVCLGYALAVRLGYGPPRLLDAWDALATRSPTRSTASRRPAAVDVPADAPAEQTAPTPIEKLLNEHHAESEDELNEGEDESHDHLGPAGPENWDLDERFVEVSIMKLNVVMMKTGTRAAEIDARLRAIQGDPDADTIRQCLAELLEDCQTYLNEQHDAAERFHDRIGGLGEMKTLGHEIETANLEQAARIETTISNLRSLDCQSDPEAARLRLLEEIGNLRVARHKLRDDQEKAFLVIARSEDRMGEIEHQLQSDPLTRLHNRIGLEATLWQWWQDGCHESRQMSAALLDLDRFRRVNERYGPLAGDRILRELGQVIQSTAGEEDVVGRFAGQQFLVMIGDCDRSAATNRAELVRQSIERITFLYGDEEIRVTASGGFTEVTPGDTHDTLFARLDQALRQAKQVGPNRAFLHDGEKTELLESPDLGAEYLEISI